MARKPASKDRLVGSVRSLEDLSEPTGRRERFWLKGKTRDLDVFRIPTRHLFFNIENGRYADKMIKLKSDNLGIEIDPRSLRWKKEIFRMLKGEYPGTEGDQEPFQKLRSDILAREQLRPGVVTTDGGVLDGNRRFAVLMDLEGAEKNPARFQYFDAVILPGDVGPEDRWRIEAGRQLGKDEMWPYSPINRLLKIKQGLRVFKRSKNPEREIAETLIGIPEKDIRKDIVKIRVIDEYLNFIGKPDGYDIIDEKRLIERFEEAVNALESAKKEQWTPDKVSRLKLTLFALIHDQTMDSYEIRDVWRAMGVTGKGKSARYKNDKALDELLKIGDDAKELQKALSSNGGKSPRQKIHRQKSEEFLDRMEALKVVHEPLRLASRAKRNLETILDTLKSGSMSEKKEWKQSGKVLPRMLREVAQLARECATRAARLVGSASSNRDNNQPRGTTQQET